MGARLIPTSIGQDIFLWKRPSGGKNMTGMSFLPLNMLQMRLIGGLQVSPSFLHIFRIVVFSGSALPVYVNYRVSPYSLLTHLLLISHEGHVPGALCSSL
jgi:hypothetical protein